MLTIHSPPVRSLAIWRRCDPVRSKSYPRLTFRIRPAYWRTSFSAIGGSAPFDNGGSVEGFKAVDTTFRGSNSEPVKNRSWFGPNGQYIRELPCPDCRGRGYLPCTECGIDRPRSDCNTCDGEGKITCPHCCGDCVTWEEFVDEQPWEKARSRSPLKVKEDDEVDNLEIKLDAPRKSKRVYKSTSPEVISKISQSLKILNEKTGLFTNHMKRVHQDPVLRAQRIASIKRAKGSPEARKKISETMKRYFSDPENRHKRSLAVKGVKFFCSNCGEEGHRKSFCPSLMQERGAFKVTCGVCGTKGHNSRSCSSKTEGNVEKVAFKVRCSVCGIKGHTRHSCPSRTEDPIKVTCGVCGIKGHNRRSCPSRTEDPIKVTCGVCGIQGHNSRSCPSKTEEVKIRCGHCGARGHRKLYCLEIRKNLGPVKLKCSLCGELGHNRRCCKKSKEEVKIRCGHCGERGHRKLYCPELRRNLGPVKFKCGLCGGLGHNRKGCKKSKEEVKKAKDAD